MNLPLDLASLLRHAAREHGGTPLITLGSDGSLRRSTWADLEQRARRWGQAWQRLGLPVGAKGTQPGRHASRKGFRSCVLYRLRLELAEGRSHLGEGGIGVGGGIGWCLQAEGAGGFAHQLPHCDGVEMQITEEAMVIADGRDGQLGAEGHQLPDLLPRRRLSSGG